MPQGVGSINLRHIPDFMQPYAVKTVDVTQWKHAKWVGLEG